MKILLIRHGIAEDGGSGIEAKDDAVRELTKAGRRKMRKAARGLNQLVPNIDVLVSSPLLRATQTADLICGASGVKAAEIAALAPRKPPIQLLEWLNAQSPDTTVALVGHEPSLSTFICWLLTGLQESFISLRKGGAALIETDTPVTAGRAKLVWLMKPGQLRKIR